jgi:hypothetical protein
MRSRRKHPRRGFAVFKALIWSTMRESVAESTEIQNPQSPSRTPSSASSAHRIETWLEQHVESLVSRWVEEVLRRANTDPAMDQLLERFLRLLAGLIPKAVGAHRSIVAPIWREAAELYGSLGAQGGLAAGEVVEEFQVLRQAVIRLLFEAPPARFGASFSLGDALGLNRFLDSGVTHASIGHTDTLFFALFQGNGVPQVPTGQLVAEVEKHLAVIEEELSAEAH